MPKRTRQTEPVEDEQSGGRPFWSGTLTFGLVSIPVNLFPATRSTRTALRMLGPDGQPLARRYYSQKTEKDLDADEMVRGYEVGKEKYVIVTDEELERLAPEKSKDIDLKLFVPEESIPPIYFERGYFLTPAAGSQKAYKLLAATMKQLGQAGVATFVMRGKEYLVAIFSDNGILRAELMRFSDELRTPSDVELPKKTKVPQATLRKFEKLIQARAKKQFSTSKLDDSQSEKLLKLIKKKKAHRKNIVEVETETKEADDNKVVDLVAVLKKSLSAKAS